MTAEQRAAWLERLREQRLEVRLLFDENLPRSLCTHLRHLFPGSKHVSDLGLLGCDDAQVWELAASFDLSIVTKDRDFADRVKADSPPPSVIQLSVGNCSVWNLVSLLTEHEGEIKTQIQFGGALLQLGVAIAQG